MSLKSRISFFNYVGRSITDLVHSIEVSGISGPYSFDRDATSLKGCFKHIREAAEGGRLSREFIECRLNQEG